MNLESLEANLAPYGWYRVADTLHSPTGNVWLMATDLEPAGLYALYASMARRAESAARHGNLSTAEDYRALLRALVDDAQIRRVVANHEAARRVFEPWAPQHGMTLRFWDFSRASIRAEARHPAGGIGCVEWIGEDPERPSLLLHHWLDDHGRSIRRSWGASMDAKLPENDELRRQLDGAVVVLLTSRVIETYVQSALARVPEGVVVDGYDGGLEVLR